MRDWNKKDFRCSSVNWKSAILLIFARIDVQNAKRVVHALEIIYESGKRVSELLTGLSKNAPST